MKNKVINITIILLLAIFISIRLSVACEQLHKEKANSEDHQPEIPAAFSGTISAASAPGVEYFLVIEEEKFKEVSWFIDRDPTPFTTEGTWELNGDTLRLFSENGEHIKSFLYSTHELLLLDLKEQQISGDLSEDYILHPISEFKSVRNHHQKLKNDGVIFSASGNEPFWSIRINSENQITYRTPDVSLTEKLTRDFSGRDLITFSISVNSMEAEFNVLEEYCMDTMSGFLFTHTITKSYNGQLVEGCGQFL